MSSIAPIEAGLVSVVIPCYGQAHYLSQAIDSILAQTYPHYEIIVVDDASPDNVTGTMTAYAAHSNIRLLHQENVGTAASRNNGVVAAHGEFLQFLDADDWLAPEKLALQVEVMRQQPEIGVAYVDVYNTYPDGTMKPQRDDLLNFYPAERDLFTALWLTNLFPVHAALLRRDWFERVGGFDPKLKGVEDHALWLRLAAGGCQMRRVPQFLAYYRRHDNNKSVNKERMSRLAEAERLSIIHEFPELVAKATTELFGPYSQFMQEADVWTKQLQASLATATDYSRNLEGQIAELTSYQRTLQTELHVQTEQVAKVSQAYADLEKYVRLLEAELQQKNEYINVLQQSHPPTEPV
ncbi:MAG: glycosyltransferase [Anaerolineae bacterium]|nr:glycosyltransferase [Anaerolineae bacterium]